MKLNLFFEIIFTLILYMAIVNGSQQLPDKISKRVWTRIGYSLEMSCVSLPNKQIEYCRWDRMQSENNTILSIQLNFNSTTTSSIQGYTVNHTALLYGECGVKIEEVTMDDVTMWNCTVTDKENNKLYNGSVEIVLTKKPTSPKILGKNDLQYIWDDENGKGNNTLNVTCCAMNGVPPPELTILFDNLKIITSSDVNKIGSHDCLCWPLAKFNWTDNGKRLKCKSEHDEYNQSSDITEDLIDMNILYSPKILTDLKMVNDSRIIVHITQPTNNHSINITFSSNPVSTVKWIRESNSTFASHAIKLHQISQWSWVTSLTLNTSNILESSTQHLQIKNQLGVKIIIFEIIRSAQKPTSPKILDKNYLQYIWDDENGKGNNTLNITCCAMNGVPPPKLTILFDNRKIITSSYVNEIGSHDCLCWPLARFNWTDNGKRLKCKSEHDEYNQSSDITEDLIDMNILYAPKILTDLKMVNGSTIIVHITQPTHNHSINITFSSNPVSTVKWIRESNSTNVNYTSKLHQISQWNWVTILTLNTSNILEGSTQHLQLQIKNHLGVKIIIFEIIRNAGQIETGMPGWMWLFYVIIGAVILQILLVMLVFMCRRNAWLCYSGRAGHFNTPRRVPTRIRTFENIDKTARPEISSPLMNTAVVLTNGTSENPTELRYSRLNWQYPGDSIRREAVELGYTVESTTVDFHATPLLFDRDSLTPHGHDHTRM